MSRPPVSPITSPIDELSPRRRELLQPLAKGLTNDEIAEALEVDPWAYEPFDWLGPAVAAR